MLSQYFFKIKRNRVSPSQRNQAKTDRVLGVLFYLSWKLALVMLAVVPIVAAGGGFYGRAVRRISTQVQDSINGTNSNSVTI